MIAPRFLDTVDPVSQASSPVADVPKVAWLGSPIWGEMPGQMLSLQLVKHFEYWQYVAINAKANAFSAVFPQISWKTKTKGRGELSQSERTWLKQSYGRHWVQSVDTDLVPVDTEHPLYQLLQRVNDGDTWCEFAYETLMYLELTGKFYWWAIGSAGFGLPVQLWCIPTQWVIPVYAKSGVLTKYIVRPDMTGWVRQVDLPPEEVIDGKFKNPRSKIHGFAPSMGGALWVSNSESIEKSRGASFTNGLNPDVILSLGQTYKNPNEEELRRLKERFIARTSGVQRAGEPLIVPPDISVEKWSNSPKEMAYPESATQVRDNVLALHGTPPIVACISSDYNRATAETATEVFCERTMNPRFRLIAGVMTEKLANRFDPDLRVWYHDSKPASAEFRLKQLQWAAANGAWSPDDTRNELGLQPFAQPWSSTPYMPMNMRPMSEDASQPTGAIDIESPEEGDQADAE